MKKGKGTYYEDSKFKEGWHYFQPSFTICADFL